MVNKKKIKNFIVESSYSDADKIMEDTLIFKEGYFDSMGFVNLLGFLEESFGIKMDDKDLVEENFESINAIADFIQRKSN